MRQQPLPGCGHLHRVHQLPSAYGVEPLVLVDRFGTVSASNQVGLDLQTATWTRVDTAMTGPAPAPRFGQFSFVRKTATAYELYIFGGATAEFAPVLLMGFRSLGHTSTFRSL